MLGQENPTVPTELLGWSTQCGEGYYTNDAGTCLDVDECSTTYDACPDTTTCINTIGSFYCSCKPGTKYNQQTENCDDIDECSDGFQTCHHNCKNNFGGYECDCRNGFKLYSDKRTCIDINECEDKNDCQHLCQNLYGKYKALLYKINTRQY